MANDFISAYAYTHQRTLRLADGQDEVKRALIAKLERARHLLVTGEVGMAVTRRR